MSSHMRNLFESGSASSESPGGPWHKGPTKLFSSFGPASAFRAVDVVRAPALERSMGRYGDPETRLFAERILAQGTWDRQR